MFTSKGCPEVAVVGEISVSTEADGGGHEGDGCRTTIGR